MSINLVTYANQTVTPTNDAIIYERAIDQNGIFHGCNVTVSGNNVNITGGYGIVCGREFVIESESIPVTLAPSGTNDGRLYVRLDLADADAPIQLLTAQGNPLPPLEQDNDVNYINGAYEMELATFTVGVSALSDVVETYETIIGTNDKITGKLPTFVVEVVNSTSVSINANSSSENSFSVAKSGYTPLGIVGYNIAGTGISAIAPYRMRLIGSTAYYGVRNYGTIQATGVTVQASILYVKFG
jgi:hypothetical protein